MITTSHTLRYNHCNMTYMQHEVRLTRKRLGIGKYGYLLIVYSFAKEDSVLAKELTLEYEQAREYAKSWIENNTK